MDVILHIGAGQGEQLEAWLAEGVRRVVLFEPHPELAERLASANKQRLNVSVAAVAIAAEEGGCSLQEYNLPEANSLRAPTDLKSLFPGLKRTNRYPVQAITPHRMMAEYGPADEEAARLVIEAPGEAYAMLQPLMESDELGRFSELQISMTVVPRYQGSVTAEQTLRALRDYGYDVVCHDDHDPDWPTWTLHRNPLKVALKQQQQALDQAEREKAKSHQECDALNQQVAELRQARASEQAKACQERDALNRQVEERQAKWKQLDQQHKKLQKELEALTVKLERKHRHFMSRKTQALKGEETIKKLQGERKTLVTAKASLQEALDTLRADHQTLEQVRADLQQKLAEKDIRLTEREAALNDYRQRYTQGLLAPVRDVSQVDFTTARRWYQREGILTDTLRALDSLRLRGERFDDAQQAFQARLEGLLRLNHVPLPPRADHPAVTSVPYQVLYCLHQSASQASNGYTQRAHAIATGLRQVGFDVVATTRPGFPWEAGASDSNSPHHTAEVEGITYVAARGTRRANTTLVHYLEEAAQHFAQQARACKAELIVAASNHMTALPALMAARRLGLPFVYEVRGLWEATRAAAQPAWADSEHYRLMRQLEQQTAREAQGVIALSDELADELAGWGVARERIAVVPQGGHTRHVQPMDADADTRAALNLAPGVPVIGYAGSATDHSGLVLQLQALARLKQQGQAFVFVLVGDGNGVDRARATARELGIEAACRFTGRVPHEQLPRYLACLDILVVPRPAAPLTEVAAEIKPLEAMAMGKALVLSDDTPHLALAGAQDQRARRFPRDNAQALSEALQDLIASPDQRQRLGQAARRWVEQERSVRQLALTFAAALEHARPTQPQRPATSEAQSPTTTALLDLAWRLASRQESPIAPVAGRVAYVVSHGQSYASNGYAVRTQGVAQALNQHGLDTLCFVRPGRPWELGVGQDDIAAEVEVDGVRYLHTPWPSSKAPHGDLERILAMAASLLEQFRTYRPAAVLAGSNWIVGLSAWIAAKRLGLPFYNEVRGFWELSREAREPGYAETPAFPQEADLDTFVAQQADKVFTLNVPMQQELARRGIDAGRIERVPNGVSQLPTLKPASLALKRKLGIAEGERVVGYVGSFSAYEGLDLLLDACTELVQSGEKLKLLLVGDSQPVTQASQRLTNLADAPWLIQVGRVPHEHVADYYALLDAVVIPRKPLAVCQLVPPMKAAEALAYGKRLVVSDVAPLAEYAEKFDGVVSFEAGSAKSLATALQRSLKLPAPPPSTELLFSVHTEPMVKALRGEGSAPVQSAVVELPAKPVEQVVPADVAVEITPKQLTLNGNSKKTVEDVIKVPVPGATLELSAAVVYRLKSGATTRKAVLLFDFLDKQGNKIATLPGIGVAAAFKQHFRYLNANTKSVDAKPQEVFKLTLPAEVASVSLAVGTLGISDEEQVELSIHGRCYSEEAEKERKRQLLQRQPLPEAIVHDPSRKRYTSDLTVACVLDEFTAECLSHEVKLIKVTQEDWQSQLEQNPPDFLLVESCWKGNDGNWGTITKGSGGGKKLSGLLRYCKQHGIPTVFWNKEDPPHYDKFGPIAALFDLAITTDVNMVPRYKADFGIDAYPLSFGAQPKVHNPEPVIPRLQKAVFAGSYYGDKPKRCEDFNAVMGQLELAGVQYDIFDRNYHKGIEKFFFPDHYQGNIVGNLPPEEVWKAHKGYKYQVNMNSVQDSATMFARRVYESLASGTPVISNDSVGVRELFGDIVIMPGEQSIAAQLKALEASPSAYQELARRGVRAVMREHTYGHRIQALCRLLGMEIEVDLPQVTLAVTARSEADIERAKQLFAAQSAQRKHLFIELDNFDTAYQFLNASDDTVTYAMQLAHEFYADQRQYYGSDRVLKHDVNEPLATEALEDFLYWGEGEKSAVPPQAAIQQEVSA